MPAKRRRLDASPAGSAAATAGPRRPLFVIAPAAFGKLPANKVGKPPVSPATHLALLGDVLVCENPDKLDTLPVGIRGPHPSARMLGIHAEWVAKAAREHPGQPIVLVGHSFGARCTAHLALGLVEVVNKGAESTTTPFDAALPSAVKGLLLCGYPIQNSKKATSPARVDVLERLWTESPLPLLLLRGTGENDAPDFQSLVDRLVAMDGGPAGVSKSAFYTDKGKHNPFAGSAKVTQLLPADGSADGVSVDTQILHYEHQNSLAMARVRHFVDECIGVPS